MPANCFPPTVHEFIYLPRVFPSSADHRRFLGGSPTLSRGDDLFEFLSRRGGKFSSRGCRSIARYFTRDEFNDSTIAFHSATSLTGPRSTKEPLPLLAHIRFRWGLEFGFFFDCLARLIARSEWNNFYFEYTSCTECDNEARIRIFIVYLWFHTCGSVRMTINFLVGKVDTRRV